MSATKYFLDTSSLRGLPFNRIKSLSQKGVLLTSSIVSFWELLSHLEEPGRFNLFKANLLKFKYINLEPTIIFTSNPHRSSQEKERLLEISDPDRIRLVLAVLDRHR